MERPFRTRRMSRFGRLALVGLPLAALSAWSVRLVPQAIHAHTAVAHCETWVTSVNRFQEAFVRLQEKGYAMHHGGPFGVEQASLQEAIDAYWRSRNLLAERTHYEQDSRLDNLDQKMSLYLAQLDRVAKATQRMEDGKGAEGKRQAAASLSLELAHLSHQFQEVTSAYDAVEAFHQHWLEESIQQMESHNHELAAFAGVSLFHALAFILLGLQADRLKRRSEDSAQLAHALLDAAPIGILIWEESGRIRRSNASMADMLGRPLRAIQGADLSSILPETVARSLVEAEPRQSVAFNLHRPDGRFAAFEAGVATATFSGEPFRVAAVGDISRRMEAERRLQERFRQAELGGRVGGVVRDLERLLHPILLAVDILRIGGASKEKANDLIALLERNGRAASDLIGQLAQLTRDAEETAKPAIFELHACIWEAVALIEVAPGLRLEVVVPDDACIVRGHRSEVTSALQALLQRGADVAGPGGFLRIEAREKGGFGLMEISDSGTGIPAPDLQTVFSASYLTTRQTDGPDLSNLPSSLREMGGTISVARGSAGQTVFTVLLPLAEA